MYKQGDIIIVSYPLSDKTGKSKFRPGLIISNTSSNDLDKDVLVCQITTKLRNTKFSFQLKEEFLTVSMPQTCEARCNKIATIRIWDKYAVDKISALTPEGLQVVLAIVGSVFAEETIEI